MARVDAFVSVIAPLCDDEVIVGAFVSEVIGVLSENYTNFELVLVDDGSKDGTIQTMDGILGHYPCVRLLRLSRRFGDEVAIAAGLDSVIGDDVVVMSPRCDPPDLIPAVVEKIRGGNGLVVGIRRDRNGDPWWLRAGASLFYRFGKRLFGIQIQRNSTYFRGMSRPAVNAIARVRDRYRYLRILSSNIGYSAATLDYDLRPRATARPRSLGEALELAIGLVVSNSAHSLRVVSWLGLFAGTLNLLYVGYIVGVHFFKAKVAEGWTTLSLQNAGMFFFVFLILVVLSEYVGRILDESRDRPLYHLIEERNSNVRLVDGERPNVVTESEAGPQ